MMYTTKSPWQLSQIDNQLIDLAFAEDLGKPYQDLTTATLFPEVKGTSRATIISKHTTAAILCGLPLIEGVLAKLDPRCELHPVYRDGQPIPPGETILSVTGPAHILLMSERIILNFLQRLCAIATLTAAFVAKVSHTKTHILDTRKTFPGCRHLEKYAVWCGGGVNHRMGLYDAIMVKDTHVDLLGGMSVAMDKLPDRRSHHVPVIVEVRSLQELSIVLAKGQQKVTRVLLDNMSLDKMAQCVLLCENLFPTEASGNVNLDNVASIAETGVDFISVGKITHSAGNIDLSMKCHIPHA